MILAIFSAGALCVAGLLAAVRLPTSLVSAPAVAASSPHAAVAAKETRVIRRCLKRSALGRCERWSMPSRHPLVDAATAQRPRPP